MALTSAPVLERTLEAPPTDTASPSGSDFAQLSARVASAGLMKRRPGYYIAKIVGTVALYAAGWALFAVVGASWWQLAIAVLIAFGTTQVAFLGHDFGHRQVFRKRNPSEIAGLLVGNLGVGMSLGWWLSKHNRHHANPNHEDDDPDVSAGALVWTPAQAAETRGAKRWMARWQAYLFFPLLFLEGLSLHVDGIKAVTTTKMRHRGWESALLFVHFAAYLTAVFAVLPVGMAFAFIGVHQALFGLYMGMSFAPNHKGMPMLTAEDDLDFLRKQVLTARNVKGAPVVDFMLGGLNYQIEHHLFPSVARANLRKVQPIVRDFCIERGVDYLQVGAVESYRQGLSYLNEVGRSTMASPVSVPVPAVTIAAQEAQ
jgi:fatty acid desaturase